MMPEMSNIGCYKERGGRRWRTGEESEANEAVFTHNHRKMMLSTFHLDTLHNNTTAIIKSGRSSFSSVPRLRLGRKY